MPSREIDFASADGISWSTAITFVVFHVLAVVALFFTTPAAVLVALALHWMCIGWGIGLGYHRLHTHRSYKTPKLVEYFFAVCATMTLQGGPIFWTALHRIHHQKSDRDGDPHTPRDGKWWAHMLWTVFGESLHGDIETMGRYAPDLMKDPFYRFLSKWHWAPLVVVGLGLFAVGGLPWVLWGIFLRVVVGLHCTWMINSVTHIWGSRRFETRDDSRNSFWVALFTFGEGWHNNHHAYPTSARHGMTWREVDLSWMQIRVMSWLGLAWDVKVPTPAQIAARTITAENDIVGIAVEPDAATPR